MSALRQGNADKVCSAKSRARCMAPSTKGLRHEAIDGVACPEQRPATRPRVPGSVSDVNRVYMLRQPESNGYAILVPFRSVWFPLVPVGSRWFRTVPIGSVSVLLVGGQPVRVPQPQAKRGRQGEHRRDACATMWPQRSRLWGIVSLPLGSPGGLVCPAERATMRAP